MVVIGTVVIDSLIVSAYGVIRTCRFAFNWPCASVLVVLIGGFMFTTPPSVALSPYRGPPSQWAARMPCSTICARISVLFDPSNPSNSDGLIASPPSCTNAIRSLDAVPCQNTISVVLGVGVTNPYRHCTPATMPKQLMPDRLIDTTSLLAYAPPTPRNSVDRKSTRLNSSH